MNNLTADARAACRAAIEKAGGAAAIGRALNLSRHAAYQWDVVPPNHLETVARLSGMSAAEIRPDLAAIFAPRRKRELA